MYYNATLCNLASADLHTGINGTVVAVGVQCLFALFFYIGTVLCHRRNEDGNVLWSAGKNNAKSMTVANGGNAIEDRRSVGLVRWGLAKAVFFFCAWAERGLYKLDAKYFSYLLNISILRFNIPNAFV